MRMFWTKVKTVFALGIGNLLRVLWYRFSVKCNINPVRRIKVDLVTGDFFRLADLPNIEAPVNTQWIERQTYFSWHIIADAQSPHWHRSCITGVDVENPLQPWWQISDFNPQLGDIKTVWEASRFDWCLGFAQQVRTSGSDTYLYKLNDWIADWVRHNPHYLGVNWKCGQEASIRVMHLAMTAIILEQTEATSPALLSLIKAHLQRIAPTISYAIAQDNNHGTSEAAALFIGGSWLANNGDSDGKRWQKMGSKWLENRAKRLITSDGSFSQYSTNYHRVMLDTYSMVEVWRVKHQLAAFSKGLYQRLQAATDWLRLMTQDSGDVPNLGANDGARLLPLTDTDYRDFRPSVQLASVLFYQQLAFEGADSYDLPAKWLGIKCPKTVRALEMTQTLTQGGYHIIRNGKNFALLNAPQFNFRPSQSDVLHVDVWINGENILIDSGTYSYADVEAVSYYSEVSAHNTVQFGDKAQMPRLGRFLLGDWLKLSLLSENTTAVQASYQNESGKHQRKLSVDEEMVEIIDVIQTQRNSARLRWHLSPHHQWKISQDNQSVLCEQFSLTIESDVACELEIEQGKSSLYYHNEQEHQVLLVQLAGSGKVRSLLRCLSPSLH